MKPGSSSHRGGFATVFAVVMIGLVSLAIVAMTSLFTTEVRRTRSQMRSAQLRQMLIAGATIADTMVRSDSDLGEPVAVRLPADLEDRGAELEIRVQRQESDLLVTISARLEGDEASQDLKFAQTPKGWGAVSAILH